MALTSLALWLDVLEPTTVLPFSTSLAQVQLHQMGRRSECCPVWYGMYDYLGRVIGLGILSTLDPYLMPPLQGLSEHRMAIPPAIAAHSAHYRPFRLRT